jgi:hypothetical protein
MRRGAGTHPGHAVATSADCPRLALESNWLSVSSRAREVISVRGREPSSVSEALAMLGGALDFLNAADLTSLPAQAQMHVLRELELLEARHATVTARLLTAFTAQAGDRDETRHRTRVGPDRPRPDRPGPGRPRPAGPGPQGPPPPGRAA